ncbi:hypothetical protein EZS27_013271 [termite gut metagenome]|uniref:Outer membrane protein beta-barrel domain-containing protein n=1 Tax=termite gut metagenome TaxID=433724 RepID=A0A5J4RXQ8_9ZZZZ
MKKIVSLLFISVCLFGMAMPADAQIGFGVKGGLNLAGTPSTDFKDATEGSTGFFIGPMVELTVPFIGIGVDGALLYSQKGSKIGGESATQQGVEVPINLKYSVGLGSIASVFVAAGPDFYFNLKSKTDLKELKKIDYKAAELGINIGAGIKALGHLQVGLNYNIPVSSAKLIEKAIGTELPFSSSSYKNKVWQVSIAYLF